MVILYGVSLLNYLLRRCGVDVGKFDIRVLELGLGIWGSKLCLRGWVVGVIMRPANRQQVRPINLEPPYWCTGTWDMLSRGMIYMRG